MRLSTLLALRRAWYIVAGPSGLSRRQRHFPSGLRFPPSLRHASCSQAAHPQLNRTPSRRLSSTPFSPSLIPRGTRVILIDSRFSVRGGFQLSLVAIDRSIWLPVTSWISPTIRHPCCDPTSLTLFTSQRNRARLRECLLEQSTIPAVPHLNQQTHHRPSLFHRDGACRTAIASERWPPSRLRVG